MQDPKTGDMLVFDGNVKPLEDVGDITISDKTDSVPRYTPDELKLQAEKQGYTVLTVGETVDIKGGEFKIHNFARKFIMLECPKNVHELPIKVGEKINIKKGSFIVEHYGAMFMKLRGIPGTGLLNQAVLDEYHKHEIEKLQKEGKV